MIAARQIFLGRGGGAQLPYDAEVEYLETTGAGNTAGPYIDTGIVPTEDTAIECDLAMLATSFYGIVIGSETSDGSNDKLHVRCRSTFWQFSGAVGNKFSDGTGSDITSGSRITLRLNREYFSYESLYVTLNYTGVLSARFPLYMFDGNLGGNAWKRRFIGRIFQMRIYDYSTNENIRDFIPVRFTNEQDQSEGAMYDRVSGQLFRNAGTGAFLIGPDKS